MISTPLSSESKALRIFCAVVLSLIAVCFFLRNLPLHLDDYDQAKQAYVSYEMVNLGDWMLQHTPRNHIATKPPLVGWLSAATFYATNNWDIAWRLPGLIAAFIMMWIIYREGRNAFGLIGAILATGFFALNILAIRLATLVRTDMVLTLCIFIVGWLIFRHLKNGTPWTKAERWGVFVAVLASMLVKGPIIFAFLIPSLIVFLVLTKNHSPRLNANPGYAVWIVPLLFFAAWVFWGATQSDAFYNEVVIKEFMGRFDDGVHKSQPPYYYLKVIGLTAPWSLLLIVFLCAKPVRHWLKSHPEVLWLLCWSIGGFIVMSLVPSKRTDRIFPVIPPAALALPYLAAAAASSLGWWQRHATKITVISATVSILGICGYSATQIQNAYASDQGVLIKLGQKARELAPIANRLMIVENDDEAVTMYAGITHFVKTNDARQAWKKNEIDVAIIRYSEWRDNARYYPGAKMVTDTNKTPNKNGRHVLIQREH